jgi:excisionase family DNA binding protein
MSAVQPSSQVKAPDSPATGTPKLGWTFEELARSLSVSVPFLRLEVKRGRLKAAHLGRRVVVLDTEVRRYLTRASQAEDSWR